VDVRVLGGKGYFMERSSCKFLPLLCVVMEVMCRREERMGADKNRNSLGAERLQEPDYPAESSQHGAVLWVAQVGGEQ
jgi:hypothetical protein